MPVLLELLGFAGITYGVYRIDDAAGIIVGGVFLVLLGVLLDGFTLPRFRRKPRDKAEA